ncbi:MAG: 1,2-phenylacetyl-CoA epoxidase, subunit D, partial [uncultured Frankineae bacterium]
EHADRVHRPHTGAGPRGAGRGHRPRDPGHHHRRPRHPARRRRGPRPDHRHHHPHLLGVPGHAGDRGRRACRARPAGLGRRGAPHRPVTGMDHRLDERGRPAQAPGVRDRPTGGPDRRTGARAAGPPSRLGLPRPGAGGLPAVRVSRHRGADPLRLHLLQVHVALPQLPRAVRPLPRPL